MTDAHVDPERDQFAAFRALPRDTEIGMLNLVRFRARALYPDDHPAAAETVTGAEAYRRYGVESGPVFARVGGSILWSGMPEAMVIGPAGERWDTAFVARYPSADAFLEMLADPAYRKAVIHRQAAVATSRLIRCGNRAAGRIFA